MKGGGREAKGHKRTGGGRTRYEERETLTCPRPSPPPPPTLISPNDIIHKIKHKGQEKSSRWLINKFLLSAPWEMKACCLSQNPVWFSQTQERARCVT